MKNAADIKLTLRAFHRGELNGTTLSLAFAVSKLGGKLVLPAEATPEELCFGKILRTYEDDEGNQVIELIDGGDYEKR